MLQKAIPAMVKKFTRRLLKPDMFTQDYLNLLIRIQQKNLNKRILYSVSKSFMYVRILH